MNETAGPCVRLTLVVAAVLACLWPAAAGVASSRLPDVVQRVCDPNTLPTSCPILSPTQSAATAPVALTAVGLRRYAAGHRVYWAGPQPRTTYEFSRTAGGVSSIRYLPAGATIGTRTARRTIVTSPFPNAFAIVHTYARAAGSVQVVLRGAVAFYDRRTPTTVYLAFAGSPYEIEVSDSAPGAAIRLVHAGRIRPVG